MTTGIYLPCGQELHWVLTRYDIFLYLSAFLTRTVLSHYGTVYCLCVHLRNTNGPLNYRCVEMTQNDEKKVLEISRFNPTINIKRTHTKQCRAIAHSTVTFKAKKLKPLSRHACWRSNYNNTSL